MKSICSILICQNDVILFFLGKLNNGSPKMFGFGQYVKEAYVSIGKLFRTYTVICTSILGGLLVCHLVNMSLYESIKNA